MGWDAIARSGFVFSIHRRLSDVTPERVRSSALRCWIPAEMLVKGFYEVILSTSNSTSHAVYFSVKGLWSLLTFPMTLLSPFVQLLIYAVTTPSLATVLPAPRTRSECVI